MQRQLKSSSVPRPGSVKEGRVSAQDQAGLLPSTARLYGFMSAERRRQFGVVIVLMLVGAFAELATIGAVLPFLTLLADPESGARLPLIGTFMATLGAE